MRSFRFLVILGLVFARADAMNSGIEKKISQGVEQKRIDVYIVQKVHDITSRYDGILGRMLDRGVRIAARPGNRKANTRELSIELGELDQCLLLDLWQDKNVEDTLKCIRTISFTFCMSSPQQSRTWEDGFNAYPWDSGKLFKVVSQPFAHSRTLMGMAGSEAVIRMLNSGFCIGNYRMEISRESASGKVDGENLLKEITSSGGQRRFWASNCYKFIYSALGQGEERYEVKLSNKTGGGQFGGVFELLEPKGKSIPVKCYCKAYWGYPAKGNFNSEKAFASSISFVRTSDISNEGPVENDYSPLDLKELFVYKVLELLRMGPKVHFFKVPDIKDGFFVMTEDLSTPGEHFIEMGKMSDDLETYIKVVLLDIRNGEFFEYEEFNALVGLLEIDTVNRIFSLHDSNEGNFGFMLKNNLVPSSRVKKSDADSWLQQAHDFRIIDFIAPYTRESYGISDIFSTFLEGNSVTKYLAGGLMDLAIRRHVDGSRDEALLKKNNDEKVFFGKKVIASLEERFSGNLEKLLKDAKNQVVAFITQGKFEEFPQQSLEQGVIDIDNYIKGICQNYLTLKNEIMQYSK